MTISFIIDYRTCWGESLVADIILSTPSGERTGQVALGTSDGHTWRGELPLNSDVTAVEYTYHVVEEGIRKRSEWSLGKHVLPILPQVPHLVVNDTWHDRPEDSYLLSSLFTHVVAQREAQPMLQVSDGHTVVLTVYAPDVPVGHTLCVLGNQPALGHWQQGKELHLIYIGDGRWQWSLDLNGTNGTVEYKYLILDAQTSRQAAWELRDNRLLPTLPVDRDTQWRMDDNRPCLPFAPWRCAGTVVPVFSLRSEQSFGIGDFGDLQPMTRWLAETGQHVLQLLPINDTTQNGLWTDSYPYNAISIYALHPIYTCLHALPPLKDEEKASAFETLRQELNALAQVDYERVAQAKHEYLWLLFQQEGERTRRTADYKRFVSDRREWLMPYAAFCTLRDKYQTADPSRWGAFSTYRDALPAGLMQDRKLALQMHFHVWMQYILHTQLTAASRYARSLGVALKGDIPIGISRNSVEAWAQPELFYMDSQAGAPPDAFSVNGQNWGFPTYNWERMLEDGCQWWRGRFQAMAQYFDAYRIDHVLGFFRIWAIPRHCVHGLLGQFQPALPMTVEEIEEAGLEWDWLGMTKPVITDAILLQVFGDEAPLVRHKWLDNQGGGYYSLKPEVDTERKVEALNLAPNVRDGLYTLIANVLFVEDTTRPGTYHPRIQGTDTPAYARLESAQQQAFARIHEDFYYHRHNQFWYRQAMQKLPLLCDATSMLVCAEDLGMVPQSVPWAMRELDMLSLEIQAMPKNPAYAFGHLWENPYASVSTISTHDMSTLRQWWDEDWTRTQRYFNDALYRQGPAPHPLPDWLAETVVMRHLESPSMLCLLSFQDWMSIDAALRLKDDARERINVPANPRNYWRYRMHLSVEQLLQSDELNRHFRRLICDSGR